MDGGRWSRWRNKLDFLDAAAVNGVLLWQFAVRTGERHPIAWALIRAVVVGVITVAALPLPQRSGYPGDASAVAVGLAVAAAAALIVRVWSPYLALVLTVLCGIAYIVHTGQFNTAMDLPVAVAVATVTATARPGIGVITTVLTWLALLVVSILYGREWFLVERIGLVSWVILGGVLGGMRQYHARHVSDLRLQARINAALSRVESDNLVIQERLRIARELHDVVAHHVATVSLQVGAATGLLPDRPDAAKTMLTGIEENARSAMSELKQVVGVLRLSSEEQGGLARASITELARLVDVFRESEVRVNLDVLGSPKVLSAHADVAAYRAVQEALTNASRHAPGAAVDVTVDYRGDLVRLTVANDVLGPIPPAYGTSEVGGYGLAGMRERAELAGGVCDAGVVEERFVVMVGFPPRLGLPNEGLL